MHARMHARTHAHGANYDLPPASRAGDNISYFMCINIQINVIVLIYIKIHHFFPPKLTLNLQKNLQKFHQ